VSIIVEISDQSLFMGMWVSRKYKFCATVYIYVIVFKLVYQLIAGEYGNGFGVRAKWAFDDGVKTNKVEAIDDIEIVIVIVSDLIEIIFANYH